VFLADARTRSAKEMLLQQVRTTRLGTIVGEHTAGAVRPCQFYFLEQDTWLMCPVHDLNRRFTLELVGLAPDVAVGSQLPYASGLDPILEVGVLVALESIGAAALSHVLPVSTAGHGVPAGAR
jgi:C-terminal processing protease CtpA/Prc